MMAFCDEQINDQDISQSRNSIYALISSHSCGGPPSKTERCTLSPISYSARMFLSHHFIQLSPSISAPLVHEV
jgi:hypothetical protein